MNENFQFFRNQRSVARVFGALWVGSGFPLFLAAKQEGTVEVHELDPLVVSAGAVPRESRDLLNPASVLASGSLRDSRSATLAETVEVEVGVHAAAYGGGAGRPVIRGFDGPRLRIMESGVDAGDLSESSPDHAVAVEPYFAERIEILRGPSTLLYGSSAIGGAINVIDRRIPREQGDGTTEGEAGVDYNSAGEGWTSWAWASLPVEDLVLSLSYLKRDLGDYTIPGYAEQTEEHEEEHEEEEHEEEDGHEDHEESYGTLKDSFSELENGSLAVSWFPDQRTRVSLALFGTDARYGVPGHVHAGHEEEAHEEEHEEAGEEAGVAIEMNQVVGDFELRHELADGWLETVEARVRIVDYAHDEIEGEEIGTAFDRESWEARISATYAMADRHAGVLGAQVSEIDFSAVGEEAFAPPSDTADRAVFVLQEWVGEPFRVEAGLRAEYRDIETGDGRSYDDWATSASLGAHYALGRSWSVGALLSRSQRLPTAVELFADGPHAATRQYEIGDPELGVEVAEGIDLSLRYTSERVSVDVTAFANDFSDYIYARPTGLIEDGLPVVAYSHVDARFRGVEVEGVWHMWHSDEAWLDLGLLFDHVVADMVHSDGHLPRIPPTRVGLRLVYESDRWSFMTMIRHAFEQDEVAEFELPTPEYTELSARVSVALPGAIGSWRLSIGGYNLLDEEIRHHASPIKDVAPAPGRHWRLALSAAF